jgi:hypothetical protein
MRLGLVLTSKICPFSAIVAEYHTLQHCLLSTTCMQDKLMDDEAAKNASFTLQCALDWISRPSFVPVTYLGSGTAHQ